MPTNATPDSSSATPPPISPDNARLGQYGDARGRLRHAALLHRLLQVLSTQQLLDMAVKTAILDATDDPYMDGVGFSAESLSRNVDPRDSGLLTGFESDAEIAYLGFFYPWNMRRGVEALKSARESLFRYPDTPEFAEQVAKLTVALVAVLTEVPA